MWRLLTLEVPRSSTLVRVGGFNLFNLELGMPPGADILWAEQNSGVAVARSLYHSGLGYLLLVAEVRQALISLDFVPSHLLMWICSLPVAFEDSTSFHALFQM